MVLELQHFWQRRGNNRGSWRDSGGRARRHVQSQDHEMWWWTGRHHHLLWIWCLNLFEIKHFKLDRQICKNRTKYFMSDEAWVWENAERTALRFKPERWKLSVLALDNIRPGRWTDGQTDRDCHVLSSWRSLKLLLLISSYYKYIVWCVYNTVHQQLSDSEDKI